MCSINLVCPSDATVELVPYFSFRGHVSYTSHIDCLLLLVAVFLKTIVSTLLLFSEYIMYTNGDGTAPKNASVLLKTCATCISMSSALLNNQTHNTIVYSREII